MSTCAAALSSCAHVKELTRIKQGQFTLEEHALLEEQWTLEHVLCALQPCSEPQQGAHCTQPPEADTWGTHSEQREGDNLRLLSVSGSFRLNCSVFPEDILSKHVKSSLILGLCLRDKSKTTVAELRDPVWLHWTCDFKTTFLWFLSLSHLFFKFYINLHGNDSAFSVFVCMHICPTLHNLNKYTTGYVGVHS